MTRSAGRDAPVGDIDVNAVAIARVWQNIDQIGLNAQQTPKMGELTGK